MGREIRKVPKGWEHPKNEDGQYQSMFEENYELAIEEFYKNHQLWLKGEHPDQKENGDYGCKYYAEYAGTPTPDAWNIYYKPEDATHFQMYETVSEGTPVSPVFETLEDLENWLVNSEGYSRAAANKFCKSGHAFSLVISNGKVQDGIAGLE